MPLARIVIVTHNARRALKRCVESALRHSPEVEIRVIDNASHDGTPILLESLARRHRRLSWARHRRNLGFSAAANRAMREDPAEWTVLIDDDVECRAGWLDRLLAAGRHAGAGVAGCRIVDHSGRIFSAELAPFWGACGQFEPDRGQRDYSRRCEAVCGACMAVRRDVFEATGGFDESFFPCQYEDLDFCLRARLKGFAVVYEGRLGLAHAHLLRDGGRRDENLRRLRGKWGDYAAFPLADSHALDRGLVELGRSVHRKDYAAALSQCARLRRHHPVPAYIDYFRGSAYAALERWRPSIRSLERALRETRLGERHRQTAELMLAQARWNLSRAR
ncbi:MAG: glycosyltransferase family 2 protein [Elusimicrobia bacterium]|nr:glycosyltransferase family 2 protein [Elusimicrobiota bacterium]